MQPVRPGSESDDSSLRVCWFGIYDPAYPRNDILLNGIRGAGADVVEVRADPRDPARHRKLRKGLRALRGGYDVVYAAFPATMPVLWAKLITRKPVVMDAFYSMHDAVVHDRKEVPWYAPRAAKLWVLDWLSALAADYLVVDTAAHGEYWSRFPFVRKGKMKVIPIGVQDRIFFPAAAPHDHAGLLVSFHGTYLPLQGVDKIVMAARLLADDPDIRFRLIGSGQVADDIRGRIRAYGLANIEEIGRIPATEVARLSRESDIILGIFGDTEKARRVVPNKVYEGLALEKLVITMDSPAIREMFDERDLVAVENTPEAIRDAILEAKANPKEAQRIAERGYAAICRSYTPASLGRELFAFLRSVIPETSSRAIVSQYQEPKERNKKS